MAIRVLPYITLEVDERLRRRVRDAADRFRINVRSHLLSAADDAAHGLISTGETVAAGTVPATTATGGVEVPGPIRRPAVTAAPMASSARSRGSFQRPRRSKTMGLCCT